MRLPPKTRWTSSTLVWPSSLLGAGAGGWCRAGRSQSTMSPTRWTRLECAEACANRRMVAEAAAAAAARLVARQEPPRAEALRPTSLAASREGESRNFLLGSAGQRRDRQTGHTCYHQPTACRRGQTCARDQPTARPQQRGKDIDRRSAVPHVDWRNHDRPVHPRVCHPPPSRWSPPRFLFCSCRCSCCWPRGFCPSAEMRQSCILLQRGEGPAHRQHQPRRGTPGDELALSPLSAVHPPPPAAPALARAQLPAVRHSGSSRVRPLVVVAAPWLPTWPPRRR